MKKAKELLEIKNQIIKNFSRADWTELGFLLGCSELIVSHDRLLRSLYFGDEDYDANVLEVLARIIEKDPKNLEEIKSILLDKYSAPSISEFVSTAHTDIPKKLISFSPQVFSVPSKNQNDKLIAVMLPFSNERTFKQIKTACDRLDLICKKADDIWENSTFIQDIFELIFTCKVVVADFTGKNPNVFYEIGVAHTLGKTVIPITQSLEDIPSDLRHHRVLKYLANEQGYAELTDDLEKRLSTLLPQTHVDNGY